MTAPNGGSCGGGWLDGLLNIRSSCGGGRCNAGWAVVMMVGGDNDWGGCVRMTRSAQNGIADLVVVFMVEGVFDRMDDDEEGVVDCKEEDVGV